jgi:hypothetical protein
MLEDLALCLTQTTSSPIGELSKAHVSGRFMN